MQQLDTVQQLDADAQSRQTAARVFLKVQDLHPFNILKKFSIK